jgi:hypothetical protein
MGVEIYPGFAGKEVLYDWSGAVVGVATGVCVLWAADVSLMCVLGVCLGECEWGGGGPGGTWLT